MIDISRETATLADFLNAQQRHIAAWIKWRECSGCADPDTSYESWSFGCMLEGAAEEAEEAGEESPVALLTGPSDLFAQAGSAGHD